MKKLKIIAVAVSVLLTYTIPAVITMADSTAAPAPVGQSAPAPLHLRITAYSSSEDETDSTPFITASGKTVRDGIVATNLLPLGTKVRIPELFGDKVFVVEDRMSPRFQKTIDIWMQTKAKAIYFGLHYANVIVVSDSPTNELTLK